MTQIQDGTGKGYYVGVDQYKRLETVSVMRSNLSFQSGLSNSYTIIFHHTTTAAGVPEMVGYLTYLGEKKLFIDYMVFMTEEDADNVTGFGIIKNPSVVSGGYHRNADNLNFSSSKILNANIYDTNDATEELIVEGGTIIGTTRLNGPSTYEYKYYESIIMEYNNTIAFKVITQNINKMVRINLFGYEKEKDI